MSEPRPVLLLPGPESTSSARHFFGDAYDYHSYLSADFRNETAVTVPNAELKRLKGRRVDVWPVPPRFWSDSNAGIESVLRFLLKLNCEIRVIAVDADDDQYEPSIMQTLGKDRSEVFSWARARIKPVDPIPPPAVPRETSVKRGKARGGADGSAPNGADVIDGDTGSVFVSWERLGLELSSNGAPHPHLANAQKILAHHPQLAGRVWYDEFHEKIFQTLFQPEPSEWTDAHDTRLTVWIQNNLRIAKLGHQTVQRAVDDYARQNVRNEVLEWMEGLTWDHRERLPSLMADAFGAEQNDYTAAVGRCWLVSMVARSYQPGCKVDTMPVFEGAQGLQKSTALSIIGGKWYSEMHEQITSKDFLQGLPGSLLIEIPELHAFGRADIRRIKGIISCPVDKYRASYGRRSEKHPRRGVWAGTTNQDDWNEDDTGARRFWPIACTTVNLDYLRDRRAHLFAEAVYRFKAGEPWWDIDAELAKAEQDKRREVDVWTNAVLQYCEGKPDVTVAEILANVIDLPLKDRGKPEQMRIASIFRVAGFKKGFRWENGRNIRVWVIVK